MAPLSGAAPRSRGSSFAGGDAATASQGGRQASGSAFDTTFWQRSQSEATRNARGRDAREEHGFDFPEEDLDDLMTTQNLEIRRRRAEAVVGDWAEDLTASGNLQSLKGKRTSSKDRPKIEQQVANLRRLQADQAQQLLAQEGQHRQQEESTKKLLQHQAEKLQRQQAEEVRLQNENELGRQEPSSPDSDSTDDDDDDDDLARLQEKENVGPVSMVDEVRHSWQGWKSKLGPADSTKKAEHAIPERRQQTPHISDRPESRPEHKRQHPFRDSSQSRPASEQQAWQWRHQTVVDEDEEEQAQEELCRQRVAKELEAERRRSEDREQEERLKQEALEHDRLETARNEQRRQAAKAERRRKDLEWEERRRKQEELEREQVELERHREERRWQKKITEAQEEIRREQDEVHRQVEVEKDQRRLERRVEEEQEKLRREQDELRRLQQKRFEEDCSDFAHSGSASAGEEQEAHSKAADPHQADVRSAECAADAEKPSMEAPNAKAKVESSPRRSSLYDVLRVSKDASAEDLRKAYKRQCMKHHPDKGGKRERFEEVGQAYQILSDKVLRHMYDQRGMAGVELLREKDKQRATAHGPEKSAEKAQPIVVEAYVPLEVAYSGGSVDVQVVRITACPPCDGSGTIPGACYMQCPKCDGQGGLPQYVQFGHVLVEQWASCDLCAGQGMVLPSTSLCSACGGKQLIEEDARVPFEIPPGAAEAERLVAKAQGHKLPNLLPGDVTLVCRIQEHPCFYRRGDDLLTEHRVPLRVAICGGAFGVPLLSGHSLRVRLPSGSVLAPGSVQCVPGEGMPKRQNPHLRGDLVIRFGVDFPESLSESTAIRLASAFEGAEPDVDRGRLQMPPTPERHEGEVYLSDFDMEQFGKCLQQETREVYEEGDEAEQARAATIAARAAQGLRPGSYTKSGGCGGNASEQCA